MSKEEIDDLSLHYGWTVREKQRVEELAKSTSIAFLKWFAENEYEFSGFDHVTDEPLFHSANLHNETADFVYELFLQSQSKQV